MILSPWASFCLFHALISFACAWRWLFCLCNLCNFMQETHTMVVFPMTNGHIDLLLVWQAPSPVDWTIPWRPCFRFQATSWCTFNTFHPIPRMTIAALPRDSGHDGGVGWLEAEFQAPKRGKGPNIDPKHQFLGLQVFGFLRGVSVCFFFAK